MSEKKQSESKGCSKNVSPIRAKERVMRLQQKLAQNSIKNTFAILSKGPFKLNLTLFWPIFDPPPSPRVIW